MLIQLSSSDNHLYLFKPGSGKYSNNVYNISDIKNNMRGLSNCLLFLHTVTSCDTTSALYRQCSKKAFNLVKHNPELQTFVKMIPNCSSTPDAVVLAGKELLWLVYHQVHSWLGNDPLPIDRGWDSVNGQLRSVLSRLPSALDALLNLMSCNCKCGCERGCGCRRAGIMCSVVCGQCRRIG